MAIKTIFLWLLLDVRFSDFCFFFVSFVTVSVGCGKGTLYLLQKNHRLIKTRQEYCIKSQLDIFSFLISVYYFIVLFYSFNISNTI